MGQSSNIGTRSRSRWACGGIQHQVPQPNPNVCRWAIVTAQYRCTLQRFLLPRLPGLPGIMILHCIGLPGIMILHCIDCMGSQSNQQNKLTKDVFLGKTLTAICVADGSTKLWYFQTTLRSMFQWQLISIETFWKIDQLIYPEEGSLKKIQEDVFF